ncbi:hypothetical protein VNO77_44235 [Canavalia gladiata]|uniref:Uncharacterized protein n=1 Tax=Canavalia gladiata TaxID=3824 RepID=A0AAN9JYK1_CANGL
MSEAPGVDKILEEKNKRKEAKIKRKLLRDTFRFPLKVPEDSGEEEDPKISHPLERIYQNSDHPIVVRSYTSTTKLGAEARQFTQSSLALPNQCRCGPEKKLEERAYESLGA